MKKLFKLLIALLLLLLQQAVLAQANEKPEPSVNLQYYNVNGTIQYLKVNVMVKEQNKLQPVKDANVQFFLDEAVAGNQIAKLITNEKGEAKATFPPSLKDKWALTPNHKFIAVLAATKKFSEVSGETEITKAKISIDTLNEDDARKVRAQVLAFENGQWVPAKDVEIKLGVRRLGGDLKIGEEETYTTDSLGQVVGEFKLDKLPAIDTKNTLVLIAKTEENELYGNLVVEKTVPWGVFVKQQTNYGKRSLWATRDKAPVWLMVMATSIIVGVWGVIIYLITQIFTIKRLGKEEKAEEQVPSEMSLDVMEV